MSDCALPSLRDTLNTEDHFGWEEGQDVFEELWYSQNRAAGWSRGDRHYRAGGVISRIWARTFSSLPRLLEGDLAGLYGCCFYSRKKRGFVQYQHAATGRKTLVLMCCRCPAYARRRGGSKVWNGSVCAITLAPLAGQWGRCSDFEQGGASC